MDERLQFAQGRWDLPCHGSHAAQLFSLGLMLKCRSHILISALLASCLSGCVSVHDISHNSSYKTDYFAGAVYRLKKPLFAGKADFNLFGSYGANLILYRIGEFGTPETTQEYTKAPETWKFIAGIVQPGTLIRVVRINLVNHPENGPEVFVQGKLVDVPWARKDAELAFVSKEFLQGQTEIHMPNVDTNILELVSKP